MGGNFRERAWLFYHAPAAERRETLARGEVVSGANDETPEIVEKV
jgi:hypothetical protein